MPQGDKPFAKWYPSIQEQAKNVNSEEFTKEKTVISAIMYQSANKKLQNKIMGEQLTLANTIKYGLVIEHGGERLIISELGHLEMDTGKTQLVRWSN